MYYDSLSNLSSQVEYGTRENFGLGTRQKRNPLNLTLNGTESFDKKKAFCSGFLSLGRGGDGGRRNKPSSILRRGDEGFLKEEFQFQLLHLARKASQPHAWVWEGREERRGCFFFFREKFAEMI